MKPFIPWTLAAIFAVGSAATLLYYRGVLEGKTAELSAAQARYASLESSSAAALKDVNEKLATAQLKLVETTTAADKKVMEISARADANAKAIADEASKKIQEVSSQGDARAKAIADEAGERLKEASLPEVTVLAGFRKGVLSSGSVANVRNVSSTSISLTLTATRSSTNQRRMFRLVVDPNAAKEIGEQEGWAFVKGDVLKVEQPGHKPKTWALN